MAKTRTPIPKTVADRVLSSCGHQCCFPMCFIEDVHLHHIDGDPSNNSENNLIVLCPNHHAETEKAKGTTRMTRGYSAKELASYKSKQENAVASAGRLAGRGNNQGVASGVLVTRLSDVSWAYKTSGSKVLLATNSASALLALGPQYRDKISGIITSDFSDHFMMQAADQQIPVLANVSLPPQTYVQHPSAEMDAGPGGGIRNVTFSPKFMESAQQAYEKALQKNILSGVAVPSQLVTLLNSRQLAGFAAAELTRWAQEWGATATTVRFALPELARQDFDLVGDTVTTLCADYQWPVGQDNARTVLPQMLRTRREETLDLLHTWFESDNLLLLKSVSMVAGTLALIDWDFAISLVERALGYPELTVAKEAARAIPLFGKVNEQYARDLRRRCQRIPDLKPIEFAARRESDFGTAWSSIPILIDHQPRGFDDIEHVAQRIATEGLDNPSLNLARNYIFDNLVPLFETDKIRCLRIIDFLRPFTLDLHIQLNLILAWAWLRREWPIEANEIFSAIDGRLQKPSEALYRQFGGI